MEGEVVTKVTIDTQVHHNALAALQAKYTLSLTNTNLHTSPAVHAIYDYMLEMVKELAGSGSAHLQNMANAHIATGQFQWTLWQTAGIKFVQDARQIGAQVE